MEQRQAGAEEGQLMRVFGSTALTRDMIDDAFTYSRSWTRQHASKVVARFGEAWYQRCLDA